MPPRPEMRDAVRRETFFLGSTGPFKRRTQSPLRRRSHRPLTARSPVTAALALLLAAVVCLGSFVAAASDIEDVLKTWDVGSVFPQAGHVGPAEGIPPSAPVFRGNKLAGYIFLTSDVINSAGYSGKPVKILVGIDLDGIITGAKVVKHQEPILVLGIPHQRLDDFIEQYTGLDIRRRVRLGPTRSDRETSIDMVSGASITSLVFNDSIIRSARLVARSRGVIGPGPVGGAKGKIDFESFEKKTWETLIKDGSVRRMILTNGEVDRAFSATVADSATSRDPKKTFIDLYAALATPATIGQNLLGFVDYNELAEAIAAGGHPIFVAANGFYSFRGYTYRRSGVFERLQLIQDSKTIRLTKGMHQRVKKLALEDAPEIREMSLFVLPSDSGFDPSRPWRLEILAERTGDGGEKLYAGFSLNYQLPVNYNRTEAGAMAEVEEEKPLWQIRWEDNLPHVVILCLSLLGLLALLVFQDWVVRHKTLINWLRLGFLSFTLVYIGWIAAAQLSVINVLTFVNSLLTGFRWDFFLLEPLIFILWGFVALALLFWGRGVFCGWLCPFGALQELISKIAHLLKVPQLEIPFALNERIWPIKYVLFLALLALSLGPTALAEQLAEVEPFKTSISLKFIRAGPFVAYAVAILMASLFVQRIFCRYLCPLGAALAIPSNNRMFNWLKRRHQCGSECNACAVICPVQAIHPNGQINTHECIYCLDCQSIYYDDSICPPLIKRRKRREHRHVLGQKGTSPATEEQTP